MTDDLLGKIVKKSLIIVGSIFILNGCAVNKDYSSAPSSKLCMDYLTYPSANIYQNARAQELARRGENCQEYMGMARARREADAQYENSLNNLQKAGQPQQRTPTRTQCTGSGMFVNCTSY